LNTGKGLVAKSRRNTRNTYRERAGGQKQKKYKEYVQGKGWWPKAEEIQGTRTGKEQEVERWNTGMYISDT
jgi:hypothetical protein